MNKLDFLNTHFDKATLNLTDMKIMCVLFDQSYLNVSDIFKSSDIVFEIETIEESVERLMKYGLIEQSNDLYLLSLDGDELIETTAKEWFETTYPDAKSANGGRIKRPITEIMDDLKKQLYEGIGEMLRDEQIKRQNFKIKFTHQKSGFKWIEIRNSGFIRIILGRHESTLIDELNKSFDNVTPIKHIDSSSIKKFDVEFTEENMENMISFIRTFI